MSTINSIKIKTRRQTNHISTKLVVMAIILLFIGIAIVPGINLNVVKASNDNGYGEITSKIYETNKPILSKTVLQSENIFFKKLYDIFKKEDSLRHPLLFIFVYSIFLSRSFRSTLLGLISITEDMGIPIVIHPILFLRAAWLLMTTYYWSLFWNHISESLSWNWPQL